jgi:hypothetical protein
MTRRLQPWPPRRLRRLLLLRIAYLVLGLLAGVLLQQWYGTRAPGCGTALFWLMPL